jgi:hypothetical protein
LSEHVAHESSEHLEDVTDGSLRSLAVVNFASVGLDLVDVGQNCLLVISLHNFSGFDASRKDTHRDHEGQAQKHDGCLESHFVEFLIRSNKNIFNFVSLLGEFR